MIEVLHGRLGHHHEGISVRKVGLVHARPSQRTQVQVDRLVGPAAGTGRMLNQSKPAVRLAKDDLTEPTAGLRAEVTTSAGLSPDLNKEVRGSGGRQRY